MPQRGNNLPDFRDLQLGFAAHIRNPDVHPRPAGIEARRMQIYLDLFYNNIESFLASTFPITKEILVATHWHELVRAFIHQHGSESPYFLEISQEFLTFLGDVVAGNRSPTNSSLDQPHESPTEQLPDHLPDLLPEFLLELCHYEWVELALSVSPTDIPVDGIDPDGDLLGGLIEVSPLTWKLAYRYPVHQLGPRYQPAHAPGTVTELVVYRRRDDTVGFLVANAVTLRLLDILEKAQNSRDALTGAAALAKLIPELPGVDESVVRERGIATLERLRDAEIILGTRCGGE